MILKKEDTIEIFRASNGFVLKKYWYETDDEQGNKVIENDTEIFGQEENEESERECIVNLLYAIAENYGFEYDKYSENNLNIDFKKKGHKL